MKAVTRKVRATERGNLIRTGGGPPDSPQPPQQGALVTMVEEVIYYDVHLCNRYVR